MPANLTQQYRRAEQAYRAAQTPEEEFACLQDMLRELPKHKGTDKLQADLKTKIARLRREQQQAQPDKRPPSHKLPRQGAGRVVLVGGPNSGKSSLLRVLTRARPEVAAYPYTTRDPTPGMMPFEEIHVQMIDTPPITADLLAPGTQTLIRGADLVLLLADMAGDEGIEQLFEVLDRLAETKTRLGRVSRLSDEDVGLSYTQSLLLLNKMDHPDAATRVELLNEFRNVELPALRIAAETGEGIPALKRTIFELLQIVRVYTKAPNRQEADFKSPFTLKAGGTILDVARLIHADLVESFQYAKVWTEGNSEGALVKGDHIVRDKDIVEIHA